MAIYDFHFSDLLDIGVVAALLWAGVVWLRRTRARMASLGLVIVGAVYLLARSFELQLTAWLLQGFFAVFAVVLVVVFQEDLRRLFEQIAVWGLRRQPTVAPPDVVDNLVRAATRLAAARTGALIVLPGHEPLDRHIEGGVALDGEVSEPLLLSLFDASSPGHDGAVVVAGDRATRFAVHLPLSSDSHQLGDAGTRHAAALGLCQRTDALCIVVSEERGSISVARDGLLRRLGGAEELTGELRRFVQSIAPPEAERSRWWALTARWREGLVAAGLSAGLWALFVPGSSVIEVERSVPVAVENLPYGYALESIEPSEVLVTLSGRRRDLYFGDPEGLELRVDALLAQLGRRTFEVSTDQVSVPEGIHAVGLRPKSVRLSLLQGKEAEAAAAEPSPPAEEAREPEAARGPEPSAESEPERRVPAEPGVELEPLLEPLVPAEFGVERAT
ncbi:MAG: diadenylate cyclase [Myxococcota bacterium]